MRVDMLKNTEKQTSCKSFGIDRELCSYLRCIVSHEAIVCSNNNNQAPNFIQTIHEREK